MLFGSFTCRIPDPRWLNMHTYSVLKKSTRTAFAQDFHLCITHVRGVQIVDERRVTKSAVVQHALHGDGSDSCPEPPSRLGFERRGIG